MEAIYAVDVKNGLSKLGSIPWHSKKDLKFFMNITKNNVVIMGKNTYFSLPEDNRPLKNRLNILLTTKPEEFKCNILSGLPSNQIVTNNDKIYDIILSNREKYLKAYPFLKHDFKIFFIGGKQIYQQFIPLCERVWVTQIKKDYDCDLCFDYDYSNEFNQELIEEDDELKIIKYEKKYIALAEAKDGSTFKLN
jgi:dihydrofolate reductase